MGFEQLNGETIIKFVTNDDEMIIETKDKIFTMYSPDVRYGNDVDVWLEDVCGDLSDVMDSPILFAEEVSNKDTLTDKTWTFYKLSTIKGSVTLRFCGRSNGYYCERLSVYITNKGEENV